MRGQRAISACVRASKRALPFDRESVRREKKKLADVLKGADHLVQSEDEKSVRIWHGDFCEREK